MSSSSAGSTNRSTRALTCQWPGRSCRRLRVRLWCRPWGMRSSICEIHMSKTLEDDRHGTVVDELDVHPRAEDAAPDVHPETAQRGAERLVERLRLLRRRRFGEARPVPF